MIMTYEELEAAYLELCLKVKRDAVQVVGKCGAGFTDSAGIAALALADYATDCRHQYLMRLEQSNGYDLAGLKVDLQSERPE